MNKKPSEQKVVLITGCSSGIGLETAIECAKKDHIVYATMRNLSKSTDLENRMQREKLNNIEIIKLDVSQIDSIENAIATIVQKTPRIDVLFNNAGFMIMGSLEDLTINEIRKQIETDLLGPIYLTKNVIPHMKNESKSLIINMSSVAGKIGFGLSSAYCISKFGIEGLTDSLRRELMNKNIDVCLIEAGIVHTKFFENMKRAQHSYDSSYAKETHEMELMINKIKNLENWSKASDVAKKVIQIIESDDRACRYVVGDDATFMIDSVHLHNDDCKKIDQTIAQIMAKYFE
ncbi:MAG: SDR family oxidoreductase [Thaumarchaeota archaeon]|nr:SDR family oxidoreductase [Nitrososphaerota archaeon]